MIPFVSQRGGGGDLATHLSNSEDNEYVELHDLRGSVADDLHGAFAEWSAQAQAMTKCKNFLLSLSINPDERDGRLTREQYEDYIARTEESCGLTGQPRAVVFHIKEGRDGDLREHCHVVWSRIDIQNCKAINIPFDRYKLMQVTREFALDHGRALPGGYETGRAKDKQLSLYEKAQQDQTGITREDRKELITKLWQRSDSPSAFVGALSDNGYILSQGRRPYLMVDYYGDVHSLPKLIDDKQVRSADVKSFLGSEYPSEELPSVEEAQDLAKHHRDNDKALVKKEEHSEEREILFRSQTERAQKLKDEAAFQAQRHNTEREAQLKYFKTEREQLEEQHARTNLEVAFKRQHNAPSGITAFLARMSGAAFVRRLLHEREDRLRSEAQHQQHIAQEANLRDERQKEDLRQGLEMRELRRRENAQKLTFTREQQSLDRKQSRELAVHQRRGYEHMPKAVLTLTPRGRLAQPARAQHRHSMQTAKELNVKANPNSSAENIADLPHDFSAASRSQLTGKNSESRGKDDTFVVRDKGKGRKR